MTLEKGIYAAVLTPFNPDFTICHDALFRHCFDLLGRGCTGITLFGTTGEGPSCSLSEKQEALEQLCLAGLDPRKLILANGSASILETVSLAQFALTKGCNTLLISPPCFYKNVKEEGVIAYYRNIILQVNDPRLQILLYHYPQMTSVPITLNIIRALRQEFPGIVIGIKESEGNLSFCHTILAECPQFHLFVGKELHIPEATTAGGSGAICGIANLFPEWIVALHQGASPLHLQKLKVFCQAIEGLPFIPLAKTLLCEWKDPCWSLIRPPLLCLTPAERLTLLTRLQKLYALTP